MGPRIIVHRVGRHGLSEGGRLLWQAMGDRGLTQEAARVQIGAAVGQIGRWIRGDGLPSGKARGALLRLFAIDPEAWDKPTAKPFSFQSHAA